MALLMALSFGFITMTATPNDKDEYERYMRYKERRHGRIDKEK